jgi:hypothetical protein
MSLRIAPVASVALLAFSVWAAPSLAAPGDTVVPAHRTRSGAYVPASVPPMSPGTRLAPPRGKGSRGSDGSDQLTTTFLVPLLADAQPIRR